MLINIITSNSFTQENLILFKCGYLCLISNVLYLLKGMSRLFTSPADSLEESFIANELSLIEMTSDLTLIKPLLLLILIDYLLDFIFLQYPFLTKLCLIHSPRLYSFLLKEVHLIFLYDWQKGVTLSFSVL